MRIAFTLVILALLASCNPKSGTEHTKPGNGSTKPQAGGNYENKKKQQKQTLQELAATGKTEVVDLRGIERRNLNGLYADMLGVSGTMPAQAKINWAKNLSAMWTKKLNRSKGVSEATIDHAHTPVAVYLEAQAKMSLPAFIQDAQTHVTTVQTLIDWKGVCTEYKLNERKCKVFVEVSREVTGTSLIAYGLTELMPSAHGSINVSVLRILLANAGANYLMAIPALYDGYLSLGMYQFTSLALRRDKGATHGASKVNAYLPKNHRIPDSVIKLRNGENHRAAYLFAIHNIASLVKQLEEPKKVHSKQKKTGAKRARLSELEALETWHTKYKADMVTYIATAHHAPRLAIECARAWLASGKEDNINPYLRGRIVAYGTKTDNNFEALSQVK